jgi:phosphate uptake regulator
VVIRTVVIWIVVIRIVVIRTVVIRIVVIRMMVTRIVVIRIVVIRIATTFLLFLKKKSLFVSDLKLILLHICEVSKDREKVANNSTAQDANIRTVNFFLITKQTH